MSTLRVNLMPVERVVKARRHAAVAAWTRWLGVYGAGLAALALCVGTMAGGPSQTQQELARVQGELQEKQRQVREHKSAIAKLQQTQRAASEVGSHPDWSTLLRYLAASGEALGSVQLTSLELSTSVREQARAQALPAASGNTPATKPARERVCKLRISGTGRAAQDALAFSKLLEDAKVFASVTMESIGGDTTSDAADARTGFVIACELSEPIAGALDASDGGSRP